jgi:membrane protease YdiL (CAAX protease family)
MNDPRRLSFAFAVFGLWLVVTVFGGRVIYGTGVSLLDLVRHSVALNILAAAAVAVGACLVFGWRDVAAGPPRPATLHLLWFPLLYLALLLGVAVLMGLPSRQTLVFIGLNTLLVGISEELMFRGILFRALVARLPVWPAIGATTALFGSVHILNGFGTGDWGSAIVQACAAALSGVALMAIMLRTGSILVAMAYHAAWDFSTFAVAAAVSSANSAAVPAPSWASVALPVLFVLPNALYGLYLLRRVGREPGSTA